MSITVTRLTTTPVKGTHLHEVEELDLRRAGAEGDRRFIIIDERNRTLNSKLLGELNTVRAEFSPDSRRLALSFPDGTVVDAEAELGKPLTARFSSATREGRLVDGPFARALSDFVGQPLRLLESPGAIDRGEHGAATLISRASLSRLAQEAGEDDVDPRRFRMTIEVDGIGPHEEDGWVGRTVSVGEASLRFHGHVGRCLITSRDPDTGEIDLPTLDILGAYRRNLGTTEPLPFGVHGEVVREGRVRVGDRVEPAQAPGGG